MKTKTLTPDEIYWYAENYIDIALEKPHKAHKYIFNLCVEYIMTGKNEKTLSLIFSKNN